MKYKARNQLLKEQQIRQKCFKYRQTHEYIDKMFQAVHASESWSDLDELNQLSFIRYVQEYLHLPAGLSRAEIEDAQLGLGMESDNPYETKAPFSIYPEFLQALQPMLPVQAYFGIADNLNLSELVARLAPIGRSEHWTNNSTGLEVLEFYQFGITIALQLQPPAHEHGCSDKVSHILHVIVKDTTPDTISRKFAQLGYLWKVFAAADKLCELSFVRCGNNFISAAELPALRSKLDWFGKEYNDTWLAELSLAISFRAELSPDGKTITVLTQGMDYFGRPELEVKAYTKTITQAEVEHLLICLLWGFFLHENEFYDGEILASSDRLHKLHLADSSFAEGKTLHFAYACPDELFNDRPE